MECDTVAAQSPGKFLGFPRSLSGQAQGRNCRLHIRLAALCYERVYTVTHKDARAEPSLVMARNERGAFYDAALCALVLEASFPYFSVAAVGLFL